MNDSRERPAGQPLMFLLAIVAGWTGLRVALWEAPPEWRARSVAAMVYHGPSLVASRARTHNAETPPRRVSPAPRLAPVPGSRLAPVPEPIEREPFDETAHRALSPPSSEELWSHDRTATAAGHNLLWMAAMAYLPMPAQVTAAAGEPEQRPDLAVGAPALRHWRLDSWLFLRQGKSSVTGAGFEPAAYGNSQAGAVLRYRFRPESRWNPSVYLRASRAVAGDGETEFAAGASVRPISGVPVDLHVEGRARNRANGAEIRPAAFVTAGVDRARLPLGVDARGYAQAGYVGGEFASAFADGSLVATREVARFDLGKLRVGAGAWGGAQRDVARLDLGPTTQVDVMLGPVPTRIAVDYRVRVAGDASPQSGAALTLSTGF